LCIFSTYDLRRIADLQYHNSFEMSIAMTIVGASFKTSSTSLSLKHHVVYKLYLLSFILLMEPKISAYRSDFLEYDFEYCFGHANFCPCTLYFHIHQHLGILCTMLDNSSRSRISYSMSQHKYKHKCELPHPRELPHFL
jgi:hypothetical protein